jgi:hypothetical protein
MIVVFEISGKGSTISQNHHPVVELNPEKIYGIGLLSFSAFNSIPNIDEGKNKLYYGNNILTFPTGAYELNSLNRYIKAVVKAGTIKIRANHSTLQTEIYSTFPIDFTQDDTIANLLGFDSIVLPPGKSMSRNLVTIFKVTMINIECNISMGSYKNGRPDRTIHQFIPRVPPGYKLISAPSNPTFYPINTRFVDTVEFTITDQHGDLVNFRDELISIRVMIKEMKNENTISQKPFDI